MKNLLPLAILAPALLSAGAALSCEYPTERPALPDGQTATHDEMVAAQKAVNSYIEKLKMYQQCLEQEEIDARTQLKDPTPEELKRRDELLNKKWDAALEEQHKAADAFNAELHEYQARDNKQ